MPSQAEQRLDDTFVPKVQTVEPVEINVQEEVRVEDAEGVGKADEGKDKVLNPPVPEKKQKRRRWRLRLKLRLKQETLQRQ